MMNSLGRQVQVAVRCVAGEAAIQEAARRHTCHLLLHARLEGARETPRSNTIVPVGQLLDLVRNAVVKLGYLVRR